jgi:hypothetical protein
MKHTMRFLRSLRYLEWIRVGRPRGYVLCPDGGLMAYWQVNSGTLAGLERSAAPFPASE